MTIEVIEGQDAIAVPIAAPRVIALIATIPARKRSCERLLGEISKQSQKPDGVILVLDGYGDEPAPACSLPVIIEHRTAKALGAGLRWRVGEGALGSDGKLSPDDILVCLDDDIMLFEAPHIIRALVKAVEAGGGAAAAMGRGTDDKFAAPGAYSRGDLIYAAGCGLTVRAKHLIGLPEFAAKIQADGGPDALGLLGDDDALVSAYLWKTGVKIRHAATGNIFAAPGMYATSQTAAAAQAGKRENPDAQKLAIKKATGWPWVDNSVRLVGGAWR